MTQCATAEYETAFASVKRFKSACIFFILIALILELAAFSVVRFADVLDPLDAQASRLPQQCKQQATTAVVTPAAASQPAATTVPPQTTTAPQSNVAGEQDPVARAMMWKTGLTWTLHTVKTITPIICMLLMFTIMLALMLALLGRLAGIAPLVCAFFWSLVLLAMIMPWQDILKGPFACGATYTLDELLLYTRICINGWGAANASIGDTIFYWIRFAAMPLISLMVCVTVMVKFASGSRQIDTVAVVEPAPVEPTYLDETIE